MNNERELFEKWYDSSSLIMEIFQRRGLGYVDPAQHNAWEAWQARATLQTKPVAWVRLSDSEWVNIVNHECAYEDYSKDDAVSLAVKLTEAQCKKNNAHAPNTLPVKKYNKLLDALKRLSESDLGVEFVKGKCPHGRYDFEYCGECYEAFASQAIAEAEGKGG